MSKSIIKRDGVEVATVPTTDVLAWFHQNNPMSMHWALANEGYSVEVVEAEEFEAAGILTKDGFTPVVEPWPTQEQFDAASAQGAQYAMNERTGGSEGPQEAPLSGEWADGITSRDVCHDVGYSIDAEGGDELAQAWEQGYFDAWAHSE